MTDWFPWTFDGVCGSSMEGVEQGGLQWSYGFLEGT